MKRIAVIMALLSIFLWCSNSVLAYPLMDGHYTVSTEVTGLAESFYKYDYAVYNVDQGTPSAFQGLNAFIIQVPLTASLRNIMNPANDPTSIAGDWRHWADTDPLGGEFSGEIPQSGYRWIGWYGQGVIYPRGTTAHFIFEMDAPPESNLGYAATYFPSHYAVFQGNVGSPVPLPPAVLLLGSGLLMLAGYRRKLKKGNHT